METGRKDETHTLPCRNCDVRLYSPKTLPAFFGYLDDLLHNIPHSQRLAVKQVIANVSTLRFLSTSEEGAGS